MKANIVLLPGDGIGPEVVSSAAAVLNVIADHFDHEFNMHEFLIGGCAIDEHNDPLPPVTLQACKQADAVLLGAVGGPKWDDPTAAIRPEQGLLGLRKELDLYANLRPIQPHPDLLSSSPLRQEKITGADFLVVRELTGGIYFGQPSERRQHKGQTQAVDTMSYTIDEIERVAHLAFKLAGQRRKKLTSVDKSNVLECSRLWRETVARISTDYPEVTLENLLVDAAAMHLLSRPASFDVMLTANMFGDILTDEASVLTGSLGNLPSASIGSQMNSLDLPLGVYEPIHGSAPDIAGKGIANPVGTILSAAMLLRHSLGLEQEAKLVERAVDATINAGHRTADLVAPGQPSLNTVEFQQQVISYINNQSNSS